MLKPWAALFVLTLGCSPKVYSIFQEGHHKFAYKSDRVIVWDVHVPPRTATRMHEHDFDYLFVTLGPAVVTSIPLHGAPTPLVLQDGEIRFTKGPLTHVARNTSNQPFHNVTIELTKPSTNVTPCDSPCVYTSDQWTAYAITLAPGEHVDTQDALVVPISYVNLTHRPEQPLRIYPGQVNDTHHPLTNAGPSDARFMLLEFK